jgi:hypothetical protein
MDVETAFLHGDIEKDIYMDAPGKYVKLDKALYVLVQTLFQFFKKFTLVLKTLVLMQAIQNHVYLLNMINMVAFSQWFMYMTTMLLEIFLQLNKG